MCLRCGGKFSVMTSLQSFGKWTATLTRNPRKCYFVKLLFYWNASDRDAQVGFQRESRGQNRLQRHRGPSTGKFILLSQPSTGPCKTRQLFEKASTSEKGYLKISYLKLFKKLNANKNETCHVYGLWSDDYVSEDSAVMLTRPAGHEAEAEARKSEAEAEADAEWFCLEATWASRP